MEPVDLRSDTVTRPSPAMREAMARAVVGDDVWGEDPTVLELEERVSALTGKDSALYVPSGTMGNQLALRSHTEPGQQLICHADAHIHRYEAGAPAALSGLQVTTIQSEDGSLPRDLVESAIHPPDDVHCAPPALIAFENTHNRCGGRIQDQDQLADVASLCRERGMRVHLDGARLFNAAVATGLTIAELAAPADSVSLCFSKGMGAPVGSVLAGPASLLLRARRFRKQWGGGMRQAGILAAACLYALDHNFARLADDHRRALRLAQEISHPGWRLLAPPQTNIVLWVMEGPRDAGDFVRELSGAGVQVSDFGPGLLRMVTHLDLDDDAITRAVEAVQASARASSPGGTR